MKRIYLTRDDLDSIQKFVNKYIDADVFELMADSSSGIGTILHVAVNTTLNGDLVQVRKTIVDVTGF